MDVSLSKAASAYQNNLKLLGDSGEAAVDEKASGPSFSQALGDALQNAVDTQHKAEDLKMQAVSGRAEISDLVTAIANAELTLTTVVAIRDRVIAAYQDIMRMPI